MTHFYLKVVKQIDKRMTEKGYKLVSVGDGEESISSGKHTKTELYDWATQTDMASLTYATIYDNAKRCTFYLIYGNGLEDTIYDMGYNCEQAEKDCEQVADEVADFYANA
jgi:hypothetical protein